MQRVSKWRDVEESCSLGHRTQCRRSVSGGREGEGQIYQSVSQSIRSATLTTEGVRGRVDVHCTRVGEPLRSEAASPLASCSSLRGGLPSAPQGQSSTIHALTGHERERERIQDTECLPRDHSSAGATVLERVHARSYAFIAFHSGEWRQ